MPDFANVIIFHSQKIHIAAEMYRNVTHLNGTPGYM